MSHKALVKKGYVVKKKYLSKKEEKEIIKDLTFQPIVMQAFANISRPKTFYTYLESLQRYYLPPFYGIEKFGPPSEIKLPSTKTNIEMYWDLYPHQEKSWNIMTKHFQAESSGGILSLPCGMGKCLGKNTPILMSDGSIKMVQNIIIGDLLMGDDSTPRRVLSTCQGRERLYEIRSIYDDVYIVNESHILCLKCYSPVQIGEKIYNSNDIIEISVKEFLLHQVDHQKVRLYRVPVEFSYQNISNDPYEYGFNIGQNQRDIYQISNNYKCNQRSIRLSVLAGLIDAIGKVCCNGYDLIVSNEKLIDDIIYLARSLGLGAYKERKNYYYKTTIYGIGMEKIPVKQVKKLKRPNFNVLEMKFTINSLEIGEYYGFELNGNGRFLLGDFQVTHNTSLAIRLAAHLQEKTIVVVNKEVLLRQWKDVIEKCTNARVGIIQRNKIEVKNKDIVIAMLHSISLKDYDDEIFNDFGLAVVDECHHIGSESFSKALPKIGCQKNLGLSATPIRKDGLTQVFMNYLGPVFHSEKREGNNQVWIKFINIKSSTEYFDLQIMEQTGTKDTGKMVTNISQYEVLNDLILEICRILVLKNRKILVLGSRREQLEWLNDKWNELSYKNSQNKYATGGLYYGNKQMNKKLYWQMLETSSKCDVIWGTNEIAKEGLDIPDLNTLILLNGGQDVEQAVGRILRKFHRDVPPTVIDLVYQCGNFPNHSNVRKNYYSDEDYIMQKFDITLTDDSNSVYHQSNKLRNFIEYYPQKDSKDIIKLKDRAKKSEIPIANHPPELPSLSTEEYRTISKPIAPIKKTKQTILVENTKSTNLLDSDDENDYDQNDYDQNDYDQMKKQLGKETTKKKSFEETKKDESTIEGILMNIPNKSTNQKKKPILVENEVIMTVPNKSVNPKKKPSLVSNEVLITIPKKKKITPKPVSIMKYDSSELKNKESIPCIHNNQ